MKTISGLVWCSAYRSGVQGNDRNVEHVIPTPTTPPPDDLGTRAECGRSQSEGQVNVHTSRYVAVLSLEVGSLGREEEA